MPTGPLRLAFPHTLASRLALAAVASAAVGCGSRPVPTPTPVPAGGPARVPATSPARPTAAAPLTPAASAAGAGDGTPGLPPVPTARGPLALRLVYPGPGDLVSAGDSGFVFGSAGTGAARVWVNGHAARVWPNGGWLAWIPLPADSAVRFRIEARAGRDSITLERVARRSAVAALVRRGTAWVDTTSLSPVGSVWQPAGEYLALTARAAPGSELRLRLPGGGAVPLVADPRAADVPAEVRAFDRDTANLRLPVQADRYVGALRGRAVGADPGPVVGGTDIVTALAAARAATGLPLAVPAADRIDPILESVHGADTVRVRWPLRVALLDTLPMVVEFADDTAGPAPPDSLTPGRAVPGGTYHWFFPAGTRAVATGRVNGEVRVGLSPAVEAWVPAVETRARPRGLPPPAGAVGSVTLTPLADRVSLRIPVGSRLPFRVTETDRALTLTLYGASGDADWVRYGQDDSLVREVGWVQSRTGEVTLNIRLNVAVWGYRTRWDQNDLILDIRRPPRLDPAAPLRGLLVAVDPGHPPGGATGPTGYREAEANLAVALRLRALLEKAGARVLMTRTADTPVELWPRVRLAADSGAAVLVSIHNNALPDGINPFTNNGTSVFYNHSQSLPLAAAIQRALVARLGLRDLGVAWADLALARPTWMPAVLCEGLFLMLPDQEAALRSPEGQERYAEGVFGGIRGFLEWRARAP